MLTEKKMPSQEKTSATIGHHNIKKFHLWHRWRRRDYQSAKSDQGLYNNALICNEGQKCEIEDITVVENFQC